MAGIVDGEGSLSIVKVVNNHMRGNRLICNTVYRVEIAIVSSTVDLLTWIKSVFGGSVDRIDNKHNHIWRWKISTENSTAFLFSIRPFLKLKGDQADLIIEYLQKYRRFNTGRVKVSEENNKLRDDLYWRLRKLHTRSGRPKNDCRHTP
jgi:hypothetical protein